MKMKRFLYMILLLALLAGLCACGQKQSTADGMSSGQSAVDSTVKPADVGDDRSDTQREPFADYEITPLADAKIGDYVLFGAYEQDNDPGNGKEPILWRVIGWTSSGPLLLSEYILDVRAFNDVLEECDWMSCSLQQWLNGEFYQAAFSEDDKARIDDVTIISQEEIHMYMGEYDEYGNWGYTLENLQCRLTDYASSRCIQALIDAGATEEQAREHLASRDNASWYWTRSMTADRRVPVTIIYSGMMDDRYSFNVAETWGGVRPVVWVSFVPLG